MVQLHHICEHCGQETSFVREHGVRRGARNRVTDASMDDAEKWKIYRRRFYLKKKAKGNKQEQAEVAESNSGTVSDN